MITEPVATLANSASPRRSWSLGRSRSGIRGKLQAAFGAVAALTVIAAAVAIVSFSRIESGMQKVVGEQVPTMTDAMQLSVISSNISASVARFVSAKTADDQLATTTLIELRNQDLAAVLDRVRDRSGSNSKLAELHAISQRIAPNLQTLQDVISDRSGLESRLQGQLDSMHKAHARIGELLAPLSQLRYALEISAQSNLVSSLLGEGSIVKEAAALAPIQGRFRAASDQLHKAAERAADDSIAKAVAALLAFGQGGESVFALRARELYASVRADSAVDENASIQRDLEHAVSALLSEAETGMRQGASNLIDDLNRNRAILLSVAIASILSAIAIGMFYVQRRLVHRLGQIGDAMRRLSAGDIDVKVPALGEPDEIGEMARSLEVFRAGEIERRTLAKRERSEQTAQHARAAAIEQTIAEFRTTFAGAIGAVAENVSRMETTAGTLSTIAREAGQQARAVSHSSEATSSSVRSVAGAADQLSASIFEISAQASQANGVVQHAAEIARSTDRRVEQLSDGASRIGDVVRLIRDIAEQTNLLALNATIEAARAGEAGRGFAVVASEVKTLASQTAKATEEIAAQVGAMQSSTAEAVDSIRSISTVMQDISGFTAAIAGAVEEQSTSTQQIVRNVQQAANGAKELAGNMVVVTRAIDQTNHSASAVLDASNALSAQASMLQGAVDIFLHKVAAS